MPRKHPQPFWREARQCYFVQLGKKQVRLSPDRDEAFRLYHELMSRPATAPPSVPAPTTTLLVVAVLDEFLEWTARHKEPRTYAWYKENLQRLIDHIPPGLPVAELKPFHVTRAMADVAHWANNTKNDFIAAVKRALNWAADEELIDRSPLARMKKPAREAREMAVSTAEYHCIIEAVQEPAFRDLIELSWETGARPQELRKIEARYYDPDSGRIIFPPRQAKGKKYYRVIYLTPRAREIVSRLRATRSSGLLLVNSKGNPWTKDAINCAFCRLQLALGRRAIAERGLGGKKPPRFRKAGVEPERLAEARKAHRAAVKAWQKDQERLARELGTKFHLGAFRKGFATEALKAGVDTVTVAHLLGHRDASMVSRVYGHVQQDPEHMAAAARKAKAVKAAADAGA
jgi:integrase